MMGCMVTLGILALFGCGGDDNGPATPRGGAADRPQAPAADEETTESRAEEKQEGKTPQGTTPQAVANCVKGVAGVSDARAQQGPFGKGDKEAGLEAAVVSDAATVFFFDSPMKARRSAKALMRGPGAYRVVGRAVIQYGREPERRLDEDLQGCLADLLRPERNLGRIGAVPGARSRCASCTAGALSPLSPDSAEPSPPGSRP